MLSTKLACIGLLLCNLASAGMLSNLSKDRFSKTQNLLRKEQRRKEK